MFITDRPIFQHRLNQSSDVQVNGIIGSNSVACVWFSFMVCALRFRVVVVLVGFHTVCILAQCCVVEVGRYRPQSSEVILSKFNLISTSAPLYLCTNKYIVNTLLCPMTEG
jgi:hypothetical protein